VLNKEPCYGETQLKVVTWATHRTIEGGGNNGLQVCENGQETSFLSESYTKVILKDLRMD